MINVNLGRNLRHEVQERDRGRTKEKSIRWGGIFHCLLGMENGRIWEVFTRKFFFFFEEPPNTGRASLYQKVVSLSLSFFPFSFLELTDWHQAQITLLPYPKRIALHLPLLWTPCQQHKLDCSNERTKITLLSKASRHKSIHFMKTWHRFLVV